MKKQNCIYKNPDMPFDERVKDLMSRMTLDEKIGQLISSWHYPFFSDSCQSNMETLLEHGLGTISWLLPGREPDENVEVMNKIQKYVFENTRLGIPVLFHGEALAGGLFYGATYFPTAIGLASTWEPEIIGEMCRAVKEQMYNYGVRVVFSPVLDIVRDPRWGRIGETYGEDPYLVSQMGKAFVSNMQGDDLKKGVACTAKHFLGYAAGEGGRNKDVLNIGRRELYEIYGRPFEAVIRDCGLRAIMNSYGVIDNVPVAASKEIMTDLLRGKMGFDGLVFSDYNAIAQLMQSNRSARNEEDAAVQALTAGIDIETPEPTTYPSLKSALDKSVINIELIDRSVGRMLRTKFELGLFEEPYASGNVKKLVMLDSNKKLAKKVAEKSMILLKNDSNLLPLKKEMSSIAVIGPNADNIRCMFGGYSSVAMREITPGALSGKKDNEDRNVDFDKEFPLIRLFMEHAGVKIGEHPTDSEKMEMVERYKSIVMPLENATRSFGDVNDPDGFAKFFYKDSLSVLSAVKQTVSDKTRVLYSKGCDVNGTSREGFSEAVAAARDSQVAVIVLGGMEGMGKTTTCGEGRDRTDITLQGLQQQLLEEIYKTGTPVVLVVINSRPLGIQWAKDNIPAIIQAWTPGEQGGRAIAEVLFGNKSPGGKLPVTIPRCIGQIPVYYNRKPVNEDMDKYMDYIDGNNEPLYPFGHGLSYTDFEFTDLEFKYSRVDSSGSVKISFNLKNTGKYEGEEVAQVYFRDREANVARPVKELVGFKRVCLKPDQTIKVTFTVDLRQMAFYNKDMEFVVEPGNMDVYVGSSSEDIRLNGEFQITGEMFYVNGNRVYTSGVEIG